MSNRFHIFCGLSQFFSSWQFHYWCLWNVRTKGHVQISLTSSCCYKKANKTGPLLPSTLLVALGSNVQSELQLPGRHTFWLQLRQAYETKALHHECPYNSSSIAVQFNHEHCDKFCKMQQENTKCSGTIISCIALPVLWDLIHTAHGTVSRTVGQCLPHDCETVTEKGQIYLSDILHMRVDPKVSVLIFLCINS